MTLGELLKDVYRLAAVPSFGERWAVMFLNDRLRRYLERRTDCRWTFEVGEEQELLFACYERMTK
mgnify:FL=1